MEHSTLLSGDVGDLLKILSTYSIPPSFQKGVVHPINFAQLRVHREGLFPAWL